MLRKEKICTLNNILEVRFALGIKKGVHVRDIDSFRSTTTWYEEIGLIPQMSTVAEVSTIQHNFTSWVEAGVSLDLENQSITNSQGNLMSCSSTLTRYPSLLSFEVSKLLTGTRSFASRTSSARLIPTGSCSTPLPSMIATVLSEDRRISSERRSGSETR